MCRLVPCLRILRGFILLKVQKGCAYMNMLFLVLILFKIYVLMRKKGISNFFVLGSPKIYCSPNQLNCNCVACQIYRIFKICFILFKITDWLSILRTNDKILFIHLFIYYFYGK